MTGSWGSGGLSSGTERGDSMPRFSTFLILVGLAMRTAAVEPYPWIPGNQKAPEPVYPEILMEASEAIDALKAGQLLPVDLRSGDEFESGHLPSAVWKAPAGLEASRILLLYGGDFKALGSAFLRFDGDPAPRILVGGLEAWIDAGGEVESGTRTEPSKEQPRFRPEALVHRSSVMDAFGRDDFEIIDLRGEESWFSALDEKGARAGHIPHSLPYDFGKLFLGRNWPDPETARAKFLELGPRDGDHVNPRATFILHGEDENDDRLGLAYLMLRLMDIEVRVYAEGWREWRSDPESPVVRILPTEELESMLRAQNEQLEDDFHYDSLMLLDLRGNLDFRRRHLPGALSLPIHLFEDSLSTLAEEHWPKVDRASVPLVLYCYGPDCIRSRNGASWAAREGFLNLLWYRDGVEGWRRAGLSLPKGKRE